MLGGLQVGEGLAEAGLQVGQGDVQAEGPSGEPEAVLDPVSSSTSLIWLNSPRPASSRYRR
jgi:hypothetical protein